MADVNVEIRETPNPDTKQFVFSLSLTDSPTEFTDAISAERSPLAAKVFGFPWASKVFIGQNFVSITKQDWVDWDILQEPLADLLKEHLTKGEPIFREMAESPSSIDPDDPDEVKTIKTILDREIRPAVALDGGDITFEKYEDDILYVNMKGACSGCPSSTATLKQGVENRLRNAIPTLKEVVSIS